MFSTGEVCILPPTPVSDPDAVALAELDMGAILLDLDLMQDQQRQVRFPGPSPSPSGFGYPPSPDMHSVSFYPEHHMAFPPVQQMGGSIPQQGGSEMSDIDNDEMVRLIMREMIPDILADCQKLNLQPNLYLWSAEEVQRWVACIMDRFELGDVELGNFYVNGATLASLQDIDFRERAPKCGDIIASVVCLLRSSMMVEPQPQVVPQIPTMHLAQPHMIPPQHTMAPPAELPPVSRYTAAPISPAGVTHRDYESGSTGSPSDDESSIPSPAAPTGPNTSMTPNHTGGIQLWQFLKELLLQPNSYSYCIRWLDRSQGIFKIEDSVEVARLWGLRKNRPAMNYDKLSRSIRQYYRKGIMKKTEVSQRLVYQFVHPC